MTEATHDQPDFSFQPELIELGPDHLIIHVRGHIAVGVQGTATVKEVYELLRTHPQLQRVPEADNGDKSYLQQSDKNA